MSIIPSDAFQVFAFNGADVRAVLIEGEPWWLAGDVCSVLEIRNVAQSVSYLDEDEKKQVSPNLISNEVAAGGRDPWLINEPGLWSLTLKSRKPQAKPFKRWITHDVLPALRKTGSYTIPGAHSTGSTLTIPQTLPAALRAYAAELDRNELLATELAEVNATNRKLSPKAARADQYEANPGITPTVFHKTYFSGVTERHFFEHLYRKDYLIDQRNARWDERKEEWKPGPEHLHPTAKGKRYFYLQPTLDRGGVRRSQTLVIPGDAEHDLVAALERDGLPSLNRPAIPGADVLHLPRQTRGEAS